MNNEKTKTKPAKTPKAKPLKTAYRTPYYNLADGVQGLLHAANKNGDKRLLKLARNAEKAEKAVLEYLNKTYLWD